MPLSEVDGPAGAPWERSLAGALDRLVVESELLAGNPLGDPARRPLYVYRPPNVDVDRSDGVPAVYVIQGYSGQLDMWLNRTPFEPTMVERLDAMFAAGDCPDALVVFVVAWTSSGGYGAMVVPMLRPDVFGALASHAGDALFECSYIPEFPLVARTLRDRFDGSYERFFE